MNKYINAAIADVERHLATAEEAGDAHAAYGLDSVLHILCMNAGRPEKQSETIRLQPIMEWD